MNVPNPVEPYGSASDLPSMKKMADQIASMRFLSRLVPGGRDEVRRLEELRRSLIATVDGFYAVLGERNWIFTDNLDWPVMAKIAQADSAEQAERMLVDYYQEEQRLDRFVLGIGGLPAMRPRMTLVGNALEDYKAGRYYSTVLVLLAVMDGFVNDVDVRNRKNLNARGADEMVAWDSVVGHHLGLSHAHVSFNKMRCKTNVEPTTELYRNGIMHGMLVDFDNEIIATKAWNRLFAVADWARAQARREAPPNPEPTLKEVAQQWLTTRKKARRIEEWVPHAHDVSADPGEWSLLDAACGDFLDRWQRKQWGLVGKHFMDPSKPRTSPGKQAELARDLYDQHVLSEWKMIQARHTGAAVAEVTVVLTVSGEAREAVVRWVHVDEGDDVSPEWVEGKWAIAPYSPESFFERAAGRTD